MCWQVADLSMGDLLLHNTVIWLNPPASLGKWKKEPELAAFGLYPRTLFQMHQGLPAVPWQILKALSIAFPRVGWNLNLGLSLCCSAQFCSLGAFLAQVKGLWAWE